MGQCCLQSCCHMPASAVQLQLQLKTTETIFCLSGVSAYPKIPAWPIRPPSIICSRCLGASGEVGTQTSLLLHSVAQNGETPHLSWRSSVKCPKLPKPVNLILADTQISAMSGHIKGNKATDPEIKAGKVIFKRCQSWEKYSYYRSSSLLFSSDFRYLIRKIAKLWRGNGEKSHLPEVCKIKFPSFEIWSSVSFLLSHHLPIKIYIPHVTAIFYKELSVFPTGNGTVLTFAVLSASSMSKFLLVYSITPIQRPQHRMKNYFIYYR